MTGNIVKLLIVFMLFFTVSAHAGKHAYPELAHKLGMDTHNILIENRLCKDIQDCRKQVRIGVGGSPDYAKVSIYKATDIDQKILTEIAQLYVTAYFDNKQKITVRLRLYDEEAQEVVKWFSRPDPLVELLFEKRGD